MKSSKDVHNIYHPTSMQSLHKGKIEENEGNDRSDEEKANAEAVGSKRYE